MAPDHRSAPHRDRDTHTPADRRAGHPSDTHDGVLIAETSETGEVAWVWVLRNGERIPRPFRRRDVGLPLDRFKPVGARHDQIASCIGATALG